MRNHAKDVGVTLARIVKTWRINEDNLSAVKFEWLGGLHNAGAGSESSSNSQARAANEVDKCSLSTARCSHNPVIDE